MRKNHTQRLFQSLKRGGLSWVVLSILLSACSTGQKSGIVLNESTPTPTAVAVQNGYATRPPYQPGELVDYKAQSGDTLDAIAIHFHTTIKEIRQANPEIPNETTTMPPGFPMKIPIYYQPLWGNPYQIIPDEFFINGPTQVNFNPREYVNSQPGWFKDFQDSAGGQLQKGGELVEHIAQNFSISPRLLLTVLEYQTGALTQSEMPDFYKNPYPLGYEDVTHKGLYSQLLWAANLLNNGYYGWRAGTLTVFEQKGKTLERADPWQNAASVALHYYFSQIYTGEDYNLAVSEQGFTQTYKKLFGDPWKQRAPHIPGSLEQPDFIFPFEPGKIWALTGGPHTGWGDGQPFAAVDFAPPSLFSGCAPSDEWVSAVADGVVARSGDASLLLDLDGDGDERTGWVVYYLHLGGYNIPPEGRRLKTGDRLGHPSCEGGEASGSHVHIARRYNGEWILAGGLPAFNFEGWIAQNGSKAYEGTLAKYSSVVRACVCSDKPSHIQSGRPIPTATPRAMLP
ncbi:MAG: LysM peptidoglycan-binding domain-containing protein [Anaerolineae bacterium]|nr:LysM peptidoglycan-binding domain-containing protein [Anaerolineae bacterium]